MGTPPPTEIASFSMPDTLILMVLALVVFGPRRLPQIGRQIGKLMYEFRKASNDFKFQMEEELRQSEEADRRKKEEAERQKALAAAPPTAQLEPPAESAAETAPATPESPASSPETSPESPYPGETVYPDLAAEGTRPEEVIEDTTASAVEAARLRIQPIPKPPSTGEIVAANPPGMAAQQAELFEPPAAPLPEDTATAPASDTPEAANEANRSEPAAHHG
jgi:sec-independent protein translocase protein TatB